MVGPQGGVHREHLGHVRAPRNQCDLRSCKQKQGKSLHKYIQRFSKLCNALPDVTDTDIIGAFHSRTTYESLVHKLRRKNWRTTKELLEIATSHVSDEETVGAIFNRSKGKAKWEELTVEGGSDHFNRKKNIEGARGLARRCS